MAISNQINYYSPTRTLDNTYYEWPPSPYGPTWDDHNNCWGTSNTTSITIATPPSPYFRQDGSIYKLVIDAPGFGREGDTLHVSVVKKTSLKVIKNDIVSNYNLPKDIDIDTLHTVVEYGQIVVTGDVICPEEINIPVEIRR